MWVKVKPPGYGLQGIVLSVLPDCGAFVFSVSFSYYPFDVRLPQKLNNHWFTRGNPFWCHPIFARHETLRPGLGPRLGRAERCDRPAPESVRSKQAADTAGVPVRAISVLEAPRQYETTGQLQFVKGKSSDPCTGHP